MSFNAEQTLHTGEVVGSIPTASTIIIELSRQYSAACDGTHREYDASIRGKSVEFVRRLFLTYCACPSPVLKQFVLFATASIRR